ncbi:hypothetical protein ACFVXE_26590 [Streptomyces sp. NPDC058231]|uniref:hypothetical protein n=1 Tax=Streptomyces sp. NPDC058231 TaxID=3346392 RepID=UPI0036EA231F
MRRGRVLGVLLPFALLAAGCGIRASGVVEVGDPATVDVAPGPRTGVLLYFIGPASPDAPLPVARQVVAKPGDTLTLLFDGPSKAERAAGMRTELPDVPGQAKWSIGQDGVSVRLGSPVTGLSELARQQLICTAAHTGGAGPGAAVTVSGTDGSIGPARCAA